MRELDLRHTQDTQLLYDLLRRNVLTLEQVKLIRSFSSKGERNETFLSCLRRCPPEHRPLLHFHQALKNHHRHLWEAYDAVLKDPEVQKLLRPLIGSHVCLRCSLNQYLDPSEFLNALLKTGTISKNLFKTLHRNISSVNHILECFREGTEAHLNNVKRCLVRVTRHRAPKLAHQIEEVADFHTLWQCQCTGCNQPLNLTGPADRKVLDCYSGSRSLCRAEAGPRNKLLKITIESTNMVEFLTYGKWDGFDAHVQSLKKSYSADSDVMAMVICHEILSLYCSGNPLQGLRKFPEFQKYVKNAKCANSIVLSFSAIEAGIYRATGHVQQADDVVRTALQRGQAFGANKAMAFLYERQGLNNLHRVDLRGNICYPTNQDLEASACSMKLAYENYHKTAEKVNDREGSLLYELEFWPLIEFVCIRLGTCITGHFYNPAGVHPKDWDEIEEAVTELRNNFPKLSPRRKAYFYLMYSDYYRRRAERAGYDHDVNPVDMWYEAGQLAEKAKATAINDNLKSAFRDYAQRRIDCLKSVIRGGSRAVVSRECRGMSCKQTAHRNPVPCNRLLPAISGKDIHQTGGYFCRNVSSDPRRLNAPQIIPDLLPGTEQHPDPAIQNHNGASEARQRNHHPDHDSLTPSHRGIHISDESLSLDLRSTESARYLEDVGSLEIPANLRERSDLNLSHSVDSCHKSSLVGNPLSSAAQREDDTGQEEVAGERRHFSDCVLLSQSNRNSHDTEDNREMPALEQPPEDQVHDIDTEIRGIVIAESL